MFREGINPNEVHLPKLHPMYQHTSKNEQMDVNTAFCKIPQYRWELQGPHGRTAVSEENP